MRSRTRWRCERNKLSDSSQYTSLQMFENNKQGRRVLVVEQEPHWPAGDVLLKWKAAGDAVRGMGLKQNYSKMLLKKYLLWKMSYWCVLDKLLCVPTPVAKNISVFVSSFSCYVRNCLTVQE